MSTAKTLDASQIDIPMEKIIGLCRCHNIRELALFGSVLREDFGPNSDIDVLVKFEPDARIGYFRFFGIEQELADLLDREVELFTPDSLKPFAREEAIKSCKVISGAGILPILRFLHRSFLYRILMNIRQFFIKKRRTFDSNRMIALLPDSVPPPFFAVKNLNPKKLATPPNRPDNS